MEGEQLLSKLAQASPATITQVNEDLALVWEQSQRLRLGMTDQLPYALAAAARLQGMAIFLEETYAAEHFRVMVLRFLHRLSELEAYARLQRDRR